MRGVWTLLTFAGVFLITYFAALAIVGGSSARIHDEGNLIFPLLVALPTAIGFAYAVAKGERRR